MTLSSQVARNTIIQIIGKTISTVIGLFALGIMARYLGQAGFGQYTTILTFLSFFGIIADFGLTLVTSQMISRPEANEELLLNNLFSLRLISAIIFICLGPLIVFFFPYEGAVKIGVLIASLSFFFTALNQILVGFFQKNLTMLAVSAAEVISRLALLGGIILTSFLNLGLFGILIATVISAAISFIIHFWHAKRFIKIKWQIDVQVWKEIIKKSWPLGVTIFLNLIYLRADIFILSLLKSQNEVGIYGATYKIIDVLTTLPFMFAGLILPILSLSWARREIDQFNQVLKKSLDAMFILGLPLIVGAQIVATPLMTLIAGPEFKASGNVLRILILAIAFIFIGCLLAHAVIALDKQKRIIGAYVFTALTSLAGYIIFIPLYSYYGAAWVTVYSELIIAIFSLMAVVKYSNFKPRLDVLLKSALASLIMGIITYLLLNKMNLIILMILAGLIYLISLYLFNGLNKKDLKNFIKPV